MREGEQLSLEGNYCPYSVKPKQWRMKACTATFIWYKTHTVSLYRMSLMGPSGLCLTLFWWESDTEGRSLSIRRNFTFVVSTSTSILSLYWELEDDLRIGGVYEEGGILKNCVHYPSDGRVLWLVWWGLGWAFGAESFPWPPVWDESPHLESLTVCSCSVSIYTDLKITPCWCCDKNWFFH